MCTQAIIISPTAFHAAEELEMQTAQKVCRARGHAGTNNHFAASKVVYQLGLKSCVPTTKTEVRAFTLVLGCSRRKEGMRLSAVSHEPQACANDCLTDYSPLSVE